MSAIQTAQHRSTRSHTGVRITRRERRLPADESRASSEHMPSSLRATASSTSTLQHWFENRLGWLVMLVAAILVFAATGCGQIRPGGHPTSTMTLPGRHHDCAHGTKTRQAGTIGAYGTPVVEVTDEPCWGAR